MSSSMLEHEFCRFDCLNDAKNVILSACDQSVHSCFSPIRSRAEIAAGGVAAARPTIPLNIRPKVFHPPVKDE